MVPQIKMVYGKERGSEAVWRWGGGRSDGKGKVSAVLGTLEVGGHCIIFLVDHTTMGTFFAHQQD